MFIEVTENAQNPQTGEYQETPMLLNTRYIGVVYDGPEGAHIIVDNALLPDNVTHVVESKAEVQRRIEAALYGEENSYTVDKGPELPFPESAV